MNGMEADDEITGSRSHYTTEFRMLDTRIGRWWGIDPVVHPSQSTYCAFDNNPILIYDPSGADGEGDKKTGEVTATVYFQWDKNEDHTEDNLQDYIDNFSNNVKENWNSYTLDNGQQVNVDNVQFLPAPEGMNASDLGKNENLLTVGNGAGSSENSMPGVSYIDKNARRNTGYMYLSGGGNEAAHEFGHMLGLSDRYFEGVTANVSSFNNQTANISRYTIPIAGIKDNGYIYNNNLMSNGGSGLTQRQLNIAFNRNRFERTYAKFSIVHSSTVLSSRNYDGFGIHGNYYLNGRAISPSRPWGTYTRNNMNFRLSPNWFEGQIKSYIRQNNLY